MFRSLVVINAAMMASALQSMQPPTSSLTKPSAPSNTASVSGYYLAKTPLLNKGTSFTSAERDSLKLRGLFPAGDPQSMDLKLENLMTQLRKKTSPIEKYTYLHTIQDGDETLYYAALCKHTSEIMPFVYTPTVRLH
jgi:hypothetical protein